MNIYKISIKKVSGRLNESALPKKCLVIKSRANKSKRSVFNEARRYLKKNYGLVLESADIDDYYDDNEEKTEKLPRGFERHESYPEWALSYAINGDASGLDDEELEMVQNFERNVGEVVDYGEESYFSSRPLFGLGCMCHDAIVRHRK